MRQKTIGSHQPIILKWIVILTITVFTLFAITSFVKSNKEGAWLGVCIVLTVYTISIYTNAFTCNITLSENGIKIRTLIKTQKYDIQQLAKISSFLTYGKISFTNGDNYIFFKGFDYIKYYLIGTSDDHNKLIENHINNYYKNIGR